MQNSQRKKSKSKTGKKPKDVENLKYIFDMLLELTRIAKSEKEISLIYYLEMAALEASAKCQAREE